MVDDDDPALLRVFQAYASGCNVVILSPSFERVQIIPGVAHDNIQISCVDCAADSGKIAVAYANQVIIFEPTPVLHGAGDVRESESPGQSAAGRLDYWWVETARITTECRVSTLAWSNEGNRLLTAGDYLQLWQYRQQHQETLGRSPPHSERNDP